MNGNGLCINIRKTFKKTLREEDMQFYSSKMLLLDLNISFNLVNIEQVKHTKFLKLETSSLCSKLFRFMYPLQKLLHNVSVKAKY